MERLLIIPAAALVASLLSAGPVAASCVGPTMPDAIAVTDSVFVGTVTGLSLDGRTATIAVEEIWRGPDLASSVLVRGGPDANGGITSVDLIWQAGAKYLVFASIVNGGLETNACTNTAVWTDEFSAQRPSDARPLTGTTADVSGRLPVEVLAVGGVALLVALVALIAFRRRAAS